VCGRTQFDDQHPRGDECDAGRHPFRQRVIEEHRCPDPDSEGLTEALAAAIHARLARVRAVPKQFLVLAELTVIARTDPTLTDLALRDRARLIELIAHLLGRWRKHTPPADLRHWATVILAGVDGLVDSWLTTRDDDITETAASLFAASVGAAVTAT
jgi:AcrR family transcriptional regulator